MASVNRITGLATGMDTESIIEKLMQAERKPLDKLEKDQTTIEWQREALLDVNSKMLAFRNETLNMKLQGTYKSYSATSSNSNIVSATTTTEAQEGVYKVTVREVATQTTLKGNVLSQNVRSGKIGNNTDFSGKEFNITYNGETKTIKIGEDGNLSGMNAHNTLKAELQRKIEDAFGTGQIQVSTRISSDRQTFSVTFSSTTSLKMPIVLTEGKNGNDALSMMGIEDGASSAFDTGRTLGGEGGLIDDAEFTDDKITLMVNNKEFTFDKNDTLGTVFSTLNKDADADINIKYSNANQCIVINRDSYGAGRNISLGGNSSFWESLGVDVEDATFMSENTQAGRNAEFDIVAPDGESAERVSVTSNNFSYAGVSMTFLEAKEDETVSITVSKNVDEVYDKIKGFVDSYNDLLSTLNKYYKEKSSGYEPLTKEEKKNLSETQEKQWEEKAKQGILRRDTILQSTVSDMRSAVTSMVNGSSISSLFQLGISTSTYDPVNSQNNGKLIIDEAVLKQAIKDDIDGVASVFSNVASPIQSSKINIDDLKESSILGKSFSITYGGETLEVTFNRGFDFDVAGQSNEFEDYLKNIFDKKFGEGAISVTYTGGRILFSSTKGVDMQVNSTPGNDALELLGMRDGAKYDSSEKGFAVKLYDICTSSMNSIIDKAGSVSNIVDTSILGQALKRKKEAVTKLESKIEALETKYYNQFAAMEKAIEQMNSQSNSLVSMLEGNN